MGTEAEGFWPKRKHPDTWVVVTHFYDTLMTIPGADPNTFTETPFPSKEAAQRHAAKIKTGMGFGTCKVLPPVTAKS